MPIPTDAELIELGKKALAAKIKDKARTRAITEATQKLISAHKDEYEGFLKAARK